MIVFWVQLLSSQRTRIGCFNWNFYPFDIYTRFPFNLVFSTSNVILIYNVINFDYANTNRQINLQKN